MPAALLRSAVSRAIRETRQASWGVRLSALAYLSAIGEGDHARLRRLTGRFAPISRGAERYYLALSGLLTGDLDNSLALLDDLPAGMIDPADVAVLKAQILDAQGRPEQAWEVIDQVMRRSRRLKLYSALADLVIGPESYQRFERTIARGRDAALIGDSLSLTEYRIKGALRAREYAAALDLAKIDYVRQAKGQRRTPQRIPAGAGEIALAHLAHAFGLGPFEFFLVSGTLLGAVREGRVLPHDNDLDVGVWEDADMTAIRKAVTRSGYFIALPERSPWTLRVRHVNGTAIDIFRHFRDGASYWHGGVKAKWHNAPFEVRRARVLGGDYLIPADAKRYLSENYGDWRTPVRAFDSVFHTPNAEIVNRAECAVHCLKKITQLSTRERSGAQAFYRERLAELI